MHERFSGCALTKACCGAIRSDLRPVRRPVDGGSVSRIACRSAGPARLTREEAANVRCAVGSWGDQAASVRVWEVMSRRRGLQGGDRPPEGVDVGYPRGSTRDASGVKCKVGASVFSMSGKATYRELRVAKETCDSSVVRFSKILPAGTSGRFLASANPETRRVRHPAFPKLRGAVR
jgi:hypothetical protein